MPTPSIRDIWNNALQDTDNIREKRPHLAYENNTGRLDSSAEMENVSANASIDPQRYKQQSVLNAAERKRKQLGLTQELNREEDTALRMAGRTEEQVQANAQQRAILQNMTDSERADNYMRYKAKDPSAIPDKYIDQDFHNLSDMELEARYGAGIGEIKRRDAIGTLGLAQQATQQSIHSGLDGSWYNPANVLGSFASGTGKTIDGTGDLLDAGRGALEGDMSKAYNKINEHGVGNSIQDFGQSLMSIDWQAANARNRALDSLDEKVVDQIAASNEMGGMDATEARKDANDIVDSVALDRLADARDIYQQSLEQAPELLAGAGVGTLVRKGATAGARAIIGNAVRKAGNELGEVARDKALREATEDLVETRVASVGKQQAQNNISTYGKKGVTKTDMDSRIGLETKIKPHKEAIESKAKHDIANNQLVQQEAKERAKDISDKFVRRSQNAVDAKASKIGDVAGRLGVGAYFGGREGSSAAGDAYKQVKDMNASYVASSPEGKKLKEQHPDWTDEQIQEQIAQNAASTAFGRQGATSFVSGTVFGGAESRLFGHGRAGTFKGALKNTRNSIAGEVPQEYAEEYGGTYNPRVAINKALGKEHFKEATGDLRSKAHVRGVQGAVTAAGSTTLTNSHELIPTSVKDGATKVASKVKDIKANQRAKKEAQEIQQASVTSTGSKTNFGKAVESTNQELTKVQGLDEGHPLGKAIKEGNFSKIVNEFSKEAKAAQARIDSGKSQNIENDQAIVNSFNTYKQKITNAIGEDFKATRQAIEADIDKAVEAINVDDTVMSGIADLLKTDPSVIAKTKDGTVDQFQTVINATQKLNPKLYDNFTKALSKLDDFEDAARILETPSVRTLMETNKKQSTDNSIGSTDDIRSGQTGKTGVVTTRQLSRMSADLENQAKELESLDKNSDDYKVKVKEFTEKANNLILSLPTIQSKLEASESKQAWKDITKYLSTLRETAKQHGVKLDNTALLTRLHKTIAGINNLIQEQNLSDKEAKTLFDKFIGSKDKKGLLTYVQESLAGNGLSPMGIYQLSHFLATQNTKHKMLGLIAKSLQNVDSGSFIPFKYKNPTLKRSDKGKQQNEIDDAYFETMEQFHKYYQTTGREVKIFNDLANSILNGEDLTFGASESTKQEPSAKNIKEPEDTGFTPSEEDKKAENETANFERNERDRQDSFEPDENDEQDTNQDGNQNDSPDVNSKNEIDSTLNKEIAKLFNENAPEGIKLSSMAGANIVSYATSDNNNINNSNVHYVVMVDFGHTKLPFYFNSGSSDRKGVASKKWYPSFGMDFKTGWLARGATSDINGYYGIDALRKVAQTLDKLFDDKFLNQNLGKIPYFDNVSEKVLDKNGKQVKDNSPNHPALNSKYKIKFTSPIFESIANQTGKFNLNVYIPSTFEAISNEIKNAFKLNGNNSSSKNKTYLINKFTRKSVEQDPESLYIFGDNFEDAKTGYIPRTTQAVVRGLSNALGISTKQDRGTKKSSYLTDNDFNDVKKHIDEQVSKIKEGLSSGKYKRVLLPVDGIGTGKAALQTKAPRIFEYLTKELQKLNPEYLKDIEFKQEYKVPENKTNEPVSELNISSYETGLGQKLSNLYPNKFEFLGRTFPSVEHAIGYTKAVLAYFADSSNEKAKEAINFYLNDEYTSLDRNLALKHKDRNSHLPLSSLDEDIATTLVQTLIEQMLLQNPKLLAELQSKVNLGTPVSHRYNGKAGSYSQAISNAVHSFITKNDEGIYEFVPEVTSFNSSENLRDNHNTWLNEFFTPSIMSNLESLNESEGSVVISDVLSFEELIAEISNADNVEEQLSYLSSLTQKNVATQPSLGSNLKTTKEQPKTNTKKSSPTVSSNSSQKTSLKDKVKAAFSGGAYGADGLWDVMLRKFGIDGSTIKHFVLGQNKNVTSKQLNTENVNANVVEQVKNLANNTKNTVLANYLNKLLQNHDKDKSDGKYISKLHLRNVLQVSNSNGVFGVMPIVNDKLGNSGTKIAVELGAISGRPTYVLSTEDSQWYSVTHVNGKFTVTPANGIPTITSKPALVGTREIESYYKNGGMTEVHPNTPTILKAMEDFLKHNNGEEVQTSQLGDVQQNFDEQNQNNNQENQEEVDELNVPDSQVEDSSYQDPEEAEFKYTKTVDESKLSATQKHLLNNRSYIKHILDRIWQQGKNSGKMDDTSFMDMRVFWRSIGLNYDMDFFKTAKFKVRNLIGSDKLNAVRNLSNKSTPEEKMKAYGEMFGIEPEVLKDLSGEEKFAIVSYADAYVGLKANIDSYFAQLPDAITKMRLNDVSPLQAKLRPTGLLNFVQFQATDNHGNGKWFFGDDFKQAMTNALIKTFQEEGQRSPKTSQVIENLTRGHDHYNVIEMNAHLGLTDEKLHEMLNTNDPKVVVKSLYTKAGILGTNKEQFIETLGRNALERLGVVLDPKEARTNQGIIGSLGQELFNALLEMNAVEVNRVQYYDEHGNPVQYIDHVNFSWNTGFQQSRPDINNSKEWFEASRSSQNKQPNRFKGNINAKHFAGIKTGFNSIAHNTLFPEAKQNYNGVRVTTDGSSNPYEATNKDIETELTSGSNDEAKSYVQALNNIPYKPNTDFYNFFKHGLGELGKAVLGYTDVSLLDTTDRIKDKFTSKNSQIDRDMDIIETYFNHPEVEGNIDKLRFFIKHRLMSNQRIQFQGALNPQSSKNIRQMLVQDSEHATTTFKPTKPIVEFFEGLIKSDNAHELGYGLAVAQALGVKIERVYDVEAFSQMAKLLNNPDHIFNKMVSLIDTLEETGSLPEDAHETIAKFSEYGNEAMRVLHTAFTVAQYNKALKSGSDFKSHLTIEADGIGNGVHNSLRQFAIGFTPAYFHSLKRTGVVTLDLAYKAMLEEKKDLDMIEGAKHIFRKDEKGKDNIDDVYESVSGMVAYILSDTRKGLAESQYARLTNKTYNSLLEILDDHDLVKDANEDLRSHFDSPAFKEIKQRKDAANFLLQQARSLIVIDAIGRLKATKDDQKLDLLNTKFEDLVSNSVALYVERAFAKAGVTPANYGGKLEGITNQLRSDIAKTLDDLAERAYKKARDSRNITDEEVRETNVRFRQFAKALMPVELNRIDFKHKSNTREDVATNANIIANAFASSKEVHQNLKESLGRLMQNAIDIVYQEQFDAIDFAISADNALFYEFEQEFNDAYAQKIRQRNIKKKWATYDNNGNLDEYLDPRANDGLTKGEIKDILANMHNSPVIATAMSKNAMLINQLFNVGNSLIKTSKDISLDAKRVAYTSRPSKAAKNINGNLTAIGTTIRDAYRKFDPAGAAALVQSVVSTESATQGRLAIELAKEGLFVLDVFDGAEMPPHMRELIGNKINELTNQVHLETRLMEAFFHKLNRSNLAESIQNINFENVDGLIRLSAYGLGEIVKPQKMRINKDNVKFLNAYVAMEIGRLLYMRLDNPTGKDAASIAAYLENMKKVRGITERLNEALAKGEDVVSLTRNDILALGLSGISTTPTNNHLNSRYNNYLRQFADLAARNRAMKDIEATYLPAVINQFGGVSNGYVHLKESKLAKQTLDAFRDWLKKEGLEVSAINMRTKQGSAILAKFVTEHFKDELKQKRAYYGKQFSPNYIKSNVLKTKFTTVGDFINGVIENSGTKDSSINPTLANTIKALVEPIKQIVGEDTKIYTNKAEFEEKFGKIQDEKSTGTYIGLINEGKIEHGIFVSEDGDVITALHEILHGIQEGYFNSYVKNPSNLDPKVKAAIDDLKTIALDVASLYKNNPEVAKLLEEANKLGENSVSLYTTNNSLMASMANITYVFSPEAAKTMSPEQLANAQVVALKEFWAYGLSQPEILNRLRYSGVRGRKDKLSLLDKVINLFKQMRTRVAQAFGFTNGKEAPNSYLIDALAAINVIGQRAEDSTKFKDVKTYSLNDLDIVQLSRVKVKPQNELLFQVAGLTASTTNKPATQVFKDIVDTSTNISSEHGEHLQDLFDTVINGIQAHKDLGKPLQLNHASAWAMLENNDLDSTANDIIRDLSKVGMVMNDAEKTAFKLMYAVNKASYDSNHQLAIETQNLMDNIIKHIEPSKFLDNGSMVYNGSAKFDAVFNNKQDPNNQMAMVMALATTHEEFRNYLQQAITQDKPKGIKRFNKKLAEAFTQATLYSNTANQITGFKDKSIVDKLNLVAAGLEFKNNVGDISRQQQQNELLLAQTKQLEAADFVNNLANGLPNQTVRNLVKGVGGFVLSGKGLTADDADSTFRKMVQDIVDDTEYLNERPTFFTKLWRWFMGAYDQTQLAYKLRSQNAVLGDAVREKVGNAITASIESEFKELTDTDRKALSKAVMPIRLHALANLRGNLKVSVPQILTNAQVHQNELNAFKQELSSKVAQILPNLNSVHQQQVVNYLNWQTAGLGELMVKGIAKGSKNTTHGILPNVRAIGAMKQLQALNHAFKHNIGTISTQDMADLVDVLQGLATLQALRYVSQSDKDTVAKLFQNERRGMKALLAELTDMDKNAMKVDPYGLLGYDGYVHNKCNPHADIQVLSNVTPEQHQELVYLGWEHSMTLPNGEAVYTTQNSLRNNWTTGAFGTSELNSFGANVVTGKSLRSTGSEVSPQLKLGKELQQRFAKVLATQDYYDTLSDYSHYRPIIDRAGSISGFEVDVSNEQRDSVVASLENDIASVGNYQARLVEEGITAKNNDRAIDALNHAYQQARDKSRYIKIDGQAKPRSSSPADVQFAQRLNDFYYMLPEANRAKIAQDGLYVHRHEVDNLIGYYQASTADIFLGTSGLPEPVQKAFKAVAYEMYRTFGVKSPAVLLRQAGRFTGEFASLTKDFILNRSMIVPAQNLLSNVLQLITAGIPVKQVVPLMIEGYRNAKAYTENQSKIIALEHELAVRNLNASQQAKHKAEILSLTNANNRNPAKALVQNGILTSVTDLSISNDKEDNQFSLFNTLSNKYGISKVKQEIPQGVKELLIQDGTKMHNTMMALMDYGDFVAKYALYQHMTKSRGLDPEHAMNVIRDEFVDYAMNRGREFDWANKIGLTWFLSYKLAIQKIFFRNMRRNALRTMAVWGSSRMAGEMVSGVPLVRDVIGETVNDQIYPIKHSLYHITPQHADIIDAHWIHKVLEAF